MSVYTLFCIFYRINFSNDWTKVFIGALILYLCLSVAEVLTAIFASLILALFGQSLEFLKNTIIINILISSLEFTIVYALKNYLKVFIDNTNTNNKFRNLMILIIILITLALLIFKVPVSNWKLNYDFFVTMIILLLFCIVGIFMIKQNSDIQKTSDMYQQVVKYSNTTNKVLEDYRMINHEHKNQLSIIRQMVSNENAELIEYIDSLIDKKNIQKYKWVAELNKLPSNGLKGLINYKFIEMEDSGISSMVTISKEASNVKLEKKLTTIQKDHLYSICGVYLDNAIEAAIKSKTKEISIDVYKEKKDLILIIANTYKGTIDLEKIDNYGYTTKGKNHGVGLHIVKSILNEDSLFSQSRKLIDKYYVQELRIHTDRLKNRKSKK